MKKKVDNLDKIKNKLMLIRAYQQQREAIDNQIDLLCYSIEKDLELLQSPSPPEIISNLKVMKSLLKKEASITTIVR